MSDYEARHSPRSTRVLGVDACKKGWMGITNDDRGYFAATIAELTAAAASDGDLEVIAIDIPIGLPVSAPRLADAEIRKLLGKRSSSVFTTPVRQALDAASHAEASAINKGKTGKGISQQAYALRTKVLEVDRWRRESQQQVIEVHPELSFATMNDEPLKYSKSTWAGIEERRAILARAGITLPAEIGRAGEMAGVDDVLDATAAMWTAERFARDQATPIPRNPENFGDGHQAAIWR